MDRRKFLQRGLLTAGALGSALPVGGKQKSEEGSKRFTLENRYLAWSLETYAGGIRSTGFENRRSSRAFPLSADREFALIFQASSPRLEIPWWEFRANPEDQPGSPDQEAGIREGYHRQDAALAGWGKAANLSGRGGGRVYPGYGWFRHSFTLPEEARGREIFFVLGGYDQQDWNERWVYVNGAEIGFQRSSGRWRTPGQFRLRPEDRLYAALRFGKGEKNLLAVRGREYDFHFEGISETAFRQYVFRPYLFDQFISVGTPYLRVSEFNLQEVKQQSAEKIAFELREAGRGIRVWAHYELDGPVRRKWLEIKNESSKDQLLLDVELEECRTDAETSEGGQGEPVFLASQAFCTVEHPAGVNQGGPGRLKLWHSPAKRLAPGETFTTPAAVFGVAETGRGLEAFHQYLHKGSPRKDRAISIFTTFGLNNQWGACSTLSEAEALDVLGVLEKWQRKGLSFDFFTLDTGWPDNAGDLKDFNPTCYPDGVGKIVEKVKSLGMKFGMWFSASWGGWSCGSYPPIQQSAIPDPGDSGEPPSGPPVGVYRNGYPTSGGIGRQLCMASEPYFRVFRDAVLHHIQNNSARLVKFDSGNYYCNSTSHGHLPGRYSVEAMYNRLIELARSARDIAPDVFLIWYWGLGSPLWALYGDTIFESGLFMEGSGTSWYPSLYYRDSVTLALDQNIQYVKLIPPVYKDSLGVWLSQIRWGNFMGRERWREALVMDMGRGNLMFPQLWGDPYLLNDGDIAFLAGVKDLARRNQKLFAQPRHAVGDSWKNEPYGYAYGEGAHGFAVLNNVHFTSRKVVFSLGPSIGLTAPAGTPLALVSHFPEEAGIVPAKGAQSRVGETVDLWLRPFEVLMLEIGPASRDTASLPERAMSSGEGSQYGTALNLTPAAQAEWMDLRFADAARFEKDGKRNNVQCFATVLPELPDGRYVMAIPIRLRRGEEEYRYAPVVAEIVQLRVRIGDHNIQLVPVPDARQYGNTQSAGCSWVLYKVLLSGRQSRKPLEFAVHSYLPDGVTARVEAWITKQWWQENTRPQADGYYGDAPS